MRLIPFKEFSSFFSRISFSLSSVLPAILSWINLLKALFSGSSRCPSRASKQCYKIVVYYDLLSVSQYLNIIGLVCTRLFFKASILFCTFTSKSVSMNVLIQWNYTIKYNNHWRYHHNWLVLCLMQAFRLYLVVCLLYAPHSSFAYEIFWLEY